VDEELNKDAEECRTIDLATQQAAMADAVLEGATGSAGPTEM